MRCACEARFSIKVTTRASARRSPLSSRVTMSVFAGVAMLAARLFALGGVIVRGSRGSWLGGDTRLLQRREIALQPVGTYVGAHVLDDGGQRGARAKVA